MHQEMDRYGVVRVSPQDLYLHVEPLSTIHPQEEGAMASETTTTFSRANGWSSHSPTRSSVAIPADGSSSSTPSATTTATGSLVSVGGRGKDIWGNYPAKEPKDLMIACPICQRMVQVARFAPHLDKCMGLGNTTRGAASSSLPLMNVSSSQGAYQRSNNISLGTTSNPGGRNNGGSMNGVGSSSGTTPGMRTMG